jgi:tRNA (Thr-GGU) A37 N-methylase
MDALDGSPLLDIKPYSKLDAVQDSRISRPNRNSNDQA